MTTLENKNTRTLENTHAYLITKKEDLISERDRMENNWNESMRSRMQTIAMASIQKFGVVLSKLA